MTTVEFPLVSRSADKPTRMVDRWLRRSLHERLAGLGHGRLKLIDGDNVRLFGSAQDDLDSDESALAASVQVNDPEFYGEVALGGSIGAAESYIRGHWNCDDLTSLVRLLVRNRKLLEDIEGVARYLRLPLEKLLQLWRRNSRAGSRRNIAAHYDLGNDFFELFLDETMSYSCGVFERPAAGLSEASLAKIDRVCRKLQLTPRDHLLEIGTGWGSLALHAAQNFGCRVTTTTISSEQYKAARERIAAAGLADRVRVVCQDFRDLEGQFDKLVSIEMIEAVGRDYLDEYFRVCERLLKPAGQMALQAILIPDRQFANYARSVDFIQRYIFPGGFLPSLGAICAALSRTSELQVFHMEDISVHYARTLNLWRARFYENLPAIRDLGYSDEFVRMWEFYLCYCEGGFLERSCACAQILLTKPRCAREPLLAAIG
jgi:cyclopropane-fatty-acyl-phospholipid synthase